MKLRCKDLNTTRVFFKVIEVPVDDFSLSQLEHIWAVVRDKPNLLAKYQEKVQQREKDIKYFETMVESIVRKKQLINSEYMTLARELDKHEFGVTLGVFSLTKIIYNTFYNLETGNSHIVWYKASAKPITTKLDSLLNEFKKYQNFYLNKYEKHYPKELSNFFYPWIELKIKKRNLFIDSSEITNETIDKAIQYKTRTQSLLAKAAAHDNQQRQFAEVIKKDLQHQLIRLNVCPYCMCELVQGEIHADHIYPVSKGGLSTAKNMVYICAKCNLQKRNMTLSAFIKKYKLDTSNVHNMLDMLGKEY